MVQSLERYFVFGTWIVLCYLDVFLIFCSLLVFYSTAMFLLSSDTIYIDPLPVYLALESMVCSYVSSNFIL